MSSQHLSRALVWILIGVFLLPHYRDWILLSKTPFEFPRKSMFRTPEKIQFLIWCQDHRESGVLLYECAQNCKQVFGWTLTAGWPCPRAASWRLEGQRWGGRWAITQQRGDLWCSESGGGKNSPTYSNDLCVQVMNNQGGQHFLINCSVHWALLKNRRAGPLGNSRNVTMDHSVISWSLWLLHVCCWYTHTHQSW